MINTRDERGWGTWHPDRPAELQQLGTGLCLTPVMYSARGNRFSTLAPQQEMRFGERAFDNNTIAFTTHLEDTILNWRYEFKGESDAALSWTCSHHGEWGLRYWVMLCVHGTNDWTFEFDRKRGALYGFQSNGDPKFEVTSEKAPLLATFHEDLQSLGDELTHHGYFYLASRGTAGQFAVLRFNLEEAPAMRLNASLQHPSRRPVTQSNSAPPAYEEMQPRMGPQSHLQAIHDVIGWNHVYDRINQRPYTCLTRNWNSRKFGGFGVWFNDILYNALLWSYFDANRALQNINAVFAWQTEDGNFPCLVTGNDAWLDRSQPPIASYVVWLLYQRSQDKALLNWAFPRLLRNYRWWWRRRRLEDTGLVAYGTSLDVGDGLYKGTKLAAKDESSMDNMPVHDPATYNEKTGLLESCDVGLNSILALDGEVLARIAAELGEGDEAGDLQTQSAAHKERIGDWLWDSSRDVFANRLLNGEFVAPLAPTSFFPLAAGIATAEQTAALITAYLEPREKFGGDIGLPSVTRDHPAYHDNMYWRGRVWAPLNYWVYQGLRRVGRAGEATRLASRSARLFASGWRRRMCGENYNAESGAIDDQADTDVFYSWGALLPALTVAEVTDVSPWHGMTLAPWRVDGEFGPVSTPIGQITTHLQENHWRVLREGKPWLEGNLDGEMRDLRVADNQVDVLVPPQTEPVWLRFPRCEIAAAHLDGQTIMTNDNKIQFNPSDKTRRLVVKLSV